MENLNKEVNQETKKKEFTDERFDFELYVNDNLICKRNFKINNYIEDSLRTTDFKEALDGIVYMLDSDLKSKSRIYMHYNYLPSDEASEFNEELLEPWACTFKIAIFDNKKEVISRIWDGYAYPKSIREKVDFTNKFVKVTNKQGKTYIFEKESFFAERGEMLTHELYVLKQMLTEQEDMLLAITRRICETCSPKEGVYQGKKDYTFAETYATPNVKGSSRRYPFSIKHMNQKYVKSWEKKVAKKTEEYFAQFKK